MKKGIIALIIIAIIGLAYITLFNEKKDDNKIIMVTEAGFAPYEYYKGKEIVGIDVDIANEIAKALGKELEIRDVEFDSILNEIKFGRGDFAAAGLTITKERKEEVDFSDEYTLTKQVIIVREDSDIQTLDDLHGKTASLQTGSLPDLQVQEDFEDVEIINTSTIYASVEDVKTGKVDFTATDEIPAQNYVKENKGLRILDESLVESSFGIAVKKGNKELLEKINEVIKKLKEEGKIEEYLINHTK